MPTIKLGTVDGVDIFQELESPDLRVFYTADLDVDVDGALHAYRLDNNSALALDDIHKSAGYPNGNWWNVLVPDPQHRSRPYVDPEGFCVSMTAYFWEGYEDTDRRTWVDALSVPYAVAPSLVRALCKGVLLGSAARVTRTTDNRSIDCVCGDLSGSNIGEASQKAAEHFGTWTARCGDERRIYLYEFFPGRSAIIDGVAYNTIPVGKTRAWV